MLCNFLSLLCKFFIYQVFSWTRFFILCKPVEIAGPVIGIFLTPASSKNMGMDFTEKVMDSLLSDHGF